MTTVVISQPMLFPWLGLFEQILLADLYVHYVDVQFSKGSFTNRVQVKTAAGSRWLTVPLRHTGLGTEIRGTQVNHREAWQRTHLATLRQSYARGKYAADMLALVETVYARHDATIGELAIRSIESVCEYYGLNRERRFLLSPELCVPGSGSSRVLAMVQNLRGSVYVTGHGARKYLDHEAFERAGIEVRYMVYRKMPYPQLHGAFTPYVSVLDLIANVGPAGRDVMVSKAVHWREFLK